MKKHKDILAKAIANLKEQGRAAEPPQEVVDETLARLARAEPSPEPADDQATKASPRSTIRLRIGAIGRWTAAAALFLVAGYALGRISTPKPPDVESLHAALLPSLAADLEPAIRARVVEETTQRYQQAMVTAYAQLKDDLTEQYRAELNRFAVQTFTASNAVTNQLLAQLVEAVELSHREDRQRVATALAQIEARRREDAQELGTALIGLAAETDHKIQYTRNEIVNLLANTQTDASTRTPDESTTIN